MAVLYISTVNLKAQSNCKLLKPGKIVITNAIYSSQSNQQYVISIVDTEAENITDSVEVYCHPSWTSTQIGTITKSVYDDEGNIYVAASSLYNIDSELSSYRYGDIGGGENDLNAAGAIYKLNAYTGEAEVFASLPQQRTTVDPVIFITFSASRETGPGLADISYNYKHQQIIAANNEDGKIYQLSRSGKLLDTFDPGLADDGDVGFAPLNERITAIETTRKRIYYAVWDSTTSYIASVRINRYGDINKNSIRVEIILSDIDEVEFPKYPITNINFIDEDIIAITQSEMLNKVTKSSLSIPTLIFEEDYYRQWEYIGSLNGSTDKTNITSISSISIPDITLDDNYWEWDYTSLLNNTSYQTNTYQYNYWGYFLEFLNSSVYQPNEIHEPSICYIGLDNLDNNYIITTNLDELTSSKSKPFSNFEQSYIPNLLGKIQSMQVVSSDKFKTASKCNENLKILNEQSDFSIYPNPCQNYFYLKNPSQKEIEFIKVYDTTGKLVKKIETKFYNKNVINKIPGVYIVSIKTKTKFNTIKLLVAE